MDMNKVSVKWMIGIGVLILVSPVFAAKNSNSKHPFYVAVDAGIFQGAFSHTYTDQSDIISQNISESVQQRGYTEGLAIGYSTLFKEDYLLGAELSANFDSHNAVFQSGASTAAFSDATQIRNHFDLTFVPGIVLSHSIAAYAKLGISFASLRDNLSSPEGTTPTMSSFNSSRTARGFAGALGIKKEITDNVFLFVEGDYHDYGTINFSDFQNFTASYSHSAHVYSYAMVLGAAYRF
jgi:opacity protein-like surface antigen